MGQFAASVASHNVAPTHAHLHAIKDRRKGLTKEEHTNIDEESNRTDKVKFSTYSPIRSSVSFL